MRPRTTIAAAVLLRGIPTIAGTFLIGVVGIAVPCSAQSQVASTVHNLSVSGPGEIRSSTETEICAFCHIPHNPVVKQPLWGHRLSSAVRYQTARVSRGSDREYLAPQPDGASRLCLSCHDGTVALGDVAGRPNEIPMIGARTLGPDRRGFIGTDLSGGHPISFAVEDDNTVGQDDRDIGIRSVAMIMADSKVELDDQGKMQCTTCHDPHKDEYHVPGVVPRFWVKPSVEEVCLTCHVLR